MLVEDDKSLREIYSIRLVAEGYDIISAGDGEEALALAVQYKPELIIADVMMPKISGFDMLDILRSQPETSKIKVIMMTALSSDDQRQRGESLGAERYLVKSQVGIEDVIMTVHEVLGDTPNANAHANLDTAATMPAVEAAVKEQQNAATQTSAAPVAPAQNPVAEATANPSAAQATTLVPDTSALNTVETTTTTTIQPANSSIPAPTPGQIIPNSPTPAETTSTAPTTQVQNPGAAPTATPVMPVVPSQPQAPQGPMPNSGM